MRRKISFALALTVLCTALLFGCVVTPASDETPSLESISFKNAVIDGGFSPDLQEYNLTLEDNTASPTLESYGIKGDANIFINYLYDDTNHAVGLTATLQYDSGSTIYTFTYTNPPEYTKNSNSTLSSIYSFYGQLEPEINENDTSYKLYIPSDLTELTITPVTDDINAYCAPVELTLSQEQEPKITLTCIASDGSTKNYTIEIKRVDKTTEQVIYEMQQPGYVSFVEGTRLFEKPEFFIAVFGILGGIIIITAMFLLTRRITTNVYDNEEKPFYSSVE